MGSAAGAGRRRPRGFGCVFGLVFLIVGRRSWRRSAFVLSHLGGLAAPHRAGRRRSPSWSRSGAGSGPAATLDQLVEATGAVEAGDYTVRVGPNRVGFAPSASWSRASTRWPPGSRPTNASGGRLLAEISHELRTPLTVVPGNLEAIIDGVYPLDPAHLEVVLDETRVLARLIDDLRTARPVRGRDPRAPPRADRPELLVAEVVRSFEAGRRSGRCGADGRHRGRPADHRHRSRAHPRGPRQPRRPTRCATPRPAAGSRSAARRRRGPLDVRDTGPASSRSCCRTSSTGS